MTVALGERAFAKVNLVLQVGRPRPDGMHPLCSLFASLELHDELRVSVTGAHDSFVCHGVEGENLASRALAAFREEVRPELPPLRVEIEKRIPVAAGLGGGSADAAAVLRAANDLAGAPLDAPRLRQLAAGLGADVPSQVEATHALVTGVGDAVEPLPLADAAVVLVPEMPGLPTAEVYAELDRLGGGRERLDPEHVRRLAAAPLPELAAGVENDLEPAAISLRPRLRQTLGALRARGAIAAAVSGSGSTAFGLFGSDGEAQRASAAFEEVLVTRVRRTG